MKELSIEQKAQRYDEAIEKARRYYDEYKTRDNILYVEDMEDMFPELIESEDEKIRKAIIEGLREMKSSFHTISSINIDDAIAWLEKQGEQKHADKVESKFKIKKDKWYICIRELYDAYNNRIFTKGNVYHSTKDETLMPDNSNVPYEIKYCPDHYFRLWTIQDAKDGDALVDEDNNIGLYRKEKDDLYWESYIYLGCDGKLYGFNIGGYHRNKNTKPATKEQRDTFFAKMKEEGFKWDASIQCIIREYSYG